MMRKLTCFFLSAVVAALASCRTDDEVISAEREELPDTIPAVRPDSVEVAQPVGLYVLCEGNMGSNKCTLDYLDLSQTPPVYNRNIYAERNPGAVKELGDVGNDVAVYRGQLWMVVNCSNKVEVATAADCRRIGQVDIPNCRSLAFHEGYAYVSSFYGPLLDSDDLEVGTVYKIDVQTLEKVDSVYVGWQPEEMAVVGHQLYVANSGGYREPDYDRTVSVIDLRTFKETRKIDVGLNLHRLRLDGQGQLWVTARGDYYDQPGRLYCMASGTDGGLMEVTDSLDIPVGGLSIVGDSLYYYAVQWSEKEKKNTISYGIIDVRTHEVVSRRLSEAPELADIQIPYGIMVHPVSRDIYLMDAKNYVSSGELFCLDRDGRFLWRVRTGDIPGHACFVYEADMLDE